jgi:hypothetical protein
MIPPIESVIYKIGEANFDMTGRLLGHRLVKLDGTITDGLAVRLRDYAAKRLREYGFPVYTRCVVEKTDNHYTVDFVNHLNGSIGIIGILLGKGGWPSIDHGFHIQTDQHAPAP